MTTVPRFPAITVVTFDAGGTLLAPYPSVGAIYGEIARQHGLAAADAELEPAFRAAFRSLVKDTTIADGEARERDYWRRVVDASFAGAASAALCDALWEAFARGERWRLLPGARATVQGLRARGYRLGVLSNWDHRLHRVLDETGLAPSFEYTLISSEVGAEKPDAAIFRAAEAAFQTAPAQCLHVGDSAAHDLGGALAAGWSGLLVDGDEAPPKSEHVIRRLADLDALLPGPG